jgi:outer membrane lipoprotein-sorting protein
MSRLLTVVAALAATALSAAQTPSPTDLARQLGTVKVLKPNHLWFAYSQPDPADWVADGRFVWDYDPTNKVAFKSDLPRGSDAPMALLFLAGSGNLTTDFTHSMPSDQPAGEWHLELRPKAPNADFESLTLMVDRRSLALRGLTIVDSQGRRTLRFTDLVENRKLTPKDFELRLPSDVIIRS